MTSVYISNENIQVVIGKKSGSKLAIKKAVSEAVAEGSIIGGVITDEAALKSQLVQMWQAYKLPKSGIRVVIESSSVDMKTVTVPNVSNSTYMTKLISESLPDPNGEEVVYDYKPLFRAPDGLITVLGCMAERSFVQSYIDLFSGAKLSLTSIDLAVCGQIRLAQFCKSLSVRTYIVAVMDHNTVSQFLFTNGSYRFSNRTRILFNRDTPEMADEIAKMISSLVQFNKSEKSGTEITDVYFCGFSSQEINTAALMLDSTMNLETLPDMPEIVYPGGKKSWLSEYVFAAANLI